MKICDQVTVLISSEHAKTLVWGDDNEDDPDQENEESDRFFSFEVATTKEQEENVSARPGFEVIPPTYARFKVIDVLIDHIR